MVSLDTDGGVKVLSEKHGIMIIFKMTFKEPAEDELKRYLLPELHIRFHPDIRFSFRFLTPDDGFPKSRL
jgi:hypothetical protein